VEELVLGLRRRRDPLPAVHLHHDRSPKVEPIERTPILPREIFGRFANESFWMDPKNNISQVPVI
jgi:hypothetical protein